MTTPGQAPQIAEYERRIQQLQAQLELLAKYRVDEIPFSTAHEKTYRDLVASGQPHDLDFEVFRRLGERAVQFFDIGANIGNSALSAHFTMKNVRIWSFEANPSLRPYLEATVQLLAGKKVAMRYFVTGLSDQPGMLKFYIPKVEGCFVIGEASFSEENFNSAHVMERLRSYSSSGVVAFIHTMLPVVTFDDFFASSIAAELAGGAEDFFICKIDVEGFELRVLRGMRKMIEQRRPLFLIENSEQAAVAAQLAEFGYGRYGYRPETGALDADAFVTSNSFYLLPEHRAVLGL
jgi:FkbM family methyltransferase